MKAEQTKLLQAKEQRPVMMDIPVLNIMKRKRTASDSSTNLAIPNGYTKRRLDPRSHSDGSNIDAGTIHHGLAASVSGVYRKTSDESSMEQHVTPKVNGNNVPSGKDDSKVFLSGYKSPDIAQIRDAIESQFSLEILLKHNELRLIDQEIGKCQAALEQLRRCQAIPYPAFTTTAEDMGNVSGGSGRSARTRNVGIQPQDPAPWGVTDGPYSRHYATWLIPDVAFDGGEIADAQLRRPAGKHIPNRARRGSKTTEQAVVSLTSRTQRGSVSSRLQALPHGYPEPKEEKGPMIVKRSDGQMVKLVCLDCRRDNFNSAQGFINHCRIAHQRGFASHEAAAIACGEEVEMSEAGAVIGESTTTSSASAGLVHPLIRSAHVSRAAKSGPTTPLSSKFNIEKTGTDGAGDTPAMPIITPDPSKPAVTAQKHKNQSSQMFIPSSQTPNLSALFVMSGRDLNLNEVVNEATTEMDMTAFDNEDVSEDEVSDHEMEDAPEEENRGHLGTRGILRGGGRQPSRARMSPAPLDRNLTRTPEQPSGSKRPEYLPRIISHDNYSSPYSNAPPEREHSQSTNGTATVHLSSTPPPNLSPNTVDSIPAPSLVSDSDDYESEDANSTSSVPESTSLDSEDDHYLNIQVHEHNEIGERDRDMGGVGVGSSENVTQGQPKVIPHPQPRVHVAPNVPTRRIRGRDDGPRRRPAVQGGQIEEVLALQREPADDSRPVRRVSFATPDRRDRRRPAKKG